MGVSDHNLEESRAVNSLFLHRDNWGDLFEEITLALYSGVLGDGDAAADCGTNHGLHTRAIARACGGSGKVFAFEAAPQMMEFTKQRTQSFGNIAYFQNALWHEAGHVLPFHFFPNEDGLSSLVGRENTSVEIKFEVTTTTLDSVVDQPLSLIKLDIEGAEYAALRGAERIMTNDRPVIVFENGRAESAQRFNYSRDDFFSMFESRGYFLYSISGMPFLRENWEDAAMPWQFIAAHPQSPRMPRVFAVTQSFLYRLRSNIR